MPLALQHAADEVGVAGARKGPLVEVDLERGFDGVAVEPVGHFVYLFELSNRTWNRVIYALCKNFYFIFFFSNLVCVGVNFFSIIFF